MLLKKKNQPPIQAVNKCLQYSPLRNKTSGAVETHLSPSSAPVTEPQVLPCPAQARAPKKEKLTAAHEQWCHQERYFLLGHL